MEKDKHARWTHFFKEDIRRFKPAEFNLIFIQQHGLTLAALLGYAFHTDRQVAFRAAWMLEHVLLNAPEQIPSVFGDLTTRLGEQKNWSAIRSFTKIGMASTDRRNTIPYTQAQEAVWIEQCFQWLIDPSCPVAVVVNCLDILSNLSSRHDWVRDELAAQIHFLLNTTPTPALTSRAQRVLKRIRPPAQGAG
ncbi:MAG TPA: hypothetical protein VK017_02565 [Sphingobacterium sp.]|jgi:hypothetical protein|nr:hypothetical protein [Sphingobacterium sp.]